MRDSVLDTAAPSDFRAVAEMAHPQVLPHPALLVNLDRIIHIAVKVNHLVQTTKESTIYDRIDHFHQ